MEKRRKKPDTDIAAGKVSLGVPKEAAARAAGRLARLGEFCLAAAGTLSTRPQAVDEGWLKRTGWEVWNGQEAVGDALAALLAELGKGGEP